MAPDRALSKEVKEAIQNTLSVSPLVYYDMHGLKRFKLLRDCIKCTLTQTTYTPLAYAANRFDGRLPNVFLADEVGALPNNSAIEAMASGQLNIKNKLGCIISTKYPKVNNPFESEVAYSKRVLDGQVEDQAIFRCCMNRIRKLPRNGLLIHWQWPRGILQASKFRKFGMI